MMDHLQGRGRRTGLTLPELRAQVRAWLDGQGPIPEALRLRRSDLSLVHHDVLDEIRRAATERGPCPHCGQ